MSRSSAPAPLLLGLLLIPALLLAACSSTEDAPPARVAVPPDLHSVSGVEFYPLPRPLVAGCKRLGERAVEPLLCPTALPRPTRAMSHAAYIPDGFHISAVRGGAGAIGISISYSAEAGSPRLNHPDRFIHFDVQTRTASEPLPPQTAPARLGGIDGRYSPATSHAYASEPYFANHARFFWREGGTRYAATLHDFGPGTRAALAAMVRGLEPAGQVRRAPPRKARGVRTFELPLAPTSVATGADGVWVAGMGGGASHLVEVGPDGETLGDPLEVSRFLAPVVVAADGGDVWIAQSGFHQPDLLQLRDDGAGFASRFTAGSSLVDLALVEGRIWALDINASALSQGGAGTLEHLDRATGRTLARIPVGRAPSAVAVGEGGVWVTNSLDGTLSRIDPGTEEVAATTPVGRAPVDVVVGHGAVWVADAEGEIVSRVDPRTSRVVARIEVGRAPRALAVGHGSVWVANYLDDSVTRIDPQSNRVTEEIPVGAGPYVIAADRDAAWVGNRLDRTLSRISP